MSKQISLTTVVAGVFAFGAVLSNSQRAKPYVKCCRECPNWDLRPEEFKPTKDHYGLPLRFGNCQVYNKVTWSDGLCEMMSEAKHIADQWKEKQNV